MRIVPLVVVFALAACSDSKDPSPPKAGTVNVTDTGAFAVPTKPSAEKPTTSADAKVGESATTTPESPAASTTPDTGAAAVATEGSAATAAPTESAASEEVSASNAKKPTAAVSLHNDHTITKGPATKIEQAAESKPPTNAIDKGAGLMVEILVAGDGPVVKSGDEVTLDYTISYVPKPVDPSKEKEADKKDKGAKGDTKKRDPSASKPKADDKKARDSKADDAKSKSTPDKPTDSKAAEETKKEDAKKDEAKPSEEKSAESNAAEAKAPAAKPDEGKTSETKPPDAKPSDAKASDSKPGDSKPGETKPGETKAVDAKVADAKADAKSDKPAAKPAESAAPKPLEPVVVASTKGWITPFTCKLTLDAKPALLPGFLRGLEGLKVGTRARITVPAELAYGKQGNATAGIPPETAILIEVVVRSAHE